jgi:glycosyltransferase involved in cell wall biosynthesis
VLFLSVRFLYPLDTGGKIRTAKILEQLRNRWGVTLVSQFIEDVDGPHRGEMEALAERYVAAPPGQRRTGVLRLLRGVRRRVFTTLPMAVVNSQSNAVRAAVARELEQGYDLFVCDFLHSMVNWPASRAYPSLLFTHNVESRITRRELERGRWLFAKAYGFWQHRLMERYERAASRWFDRVIAVSESDRQELERRLGFTGVRVIPTGVDADHLRPSGRPVQPGLIVFCGSMDWVPNQDGVAWFVESVLPRVRGEVPGARLAVVGKAPPRRFAARLAAQGPVEFTGWVEDVRPWLDQAACCIVPLRIAGGTRIKIYEALAMERALVATSIGAEGLAIEPGLHFHCADAPEAFAARVVECLRDHSAAAAMGRRARAHVRDRFGWESVARAFAEAGEEAIEAWREGLRRRSEECRGGAAGVRGG